MNKKRTKSNRGRKPGTAVLSGIRPEHEWDDIRARIIYDSAEWRMVALQDLIKNGSQLPSNYLSAPRDVRCSPYAQRPEGVYPLRNKLCFEFERAVLNADARWFERQAKAIKKGIKLDKRAQFNAKVVHLLEIAMWETLGRPDNWRPLTDAEREAFPNLRRVPQVVTFTPAGKSTDKTASDIYNALDVEELPNGLLLVEGWHFENKERVMEAIHDLARQLQFELKKQARRVSLS
jgi:hypothetical protein